MCMEMIRSLRELSFVFRGFGDSDVGSDISELLGGIVYFWDWGLCRICRRSHKRMVYGVGGICRRCWELGVRHIVEFSYNVVYGGDVSDELSWGIVRSYGMIRDIGRRAFREYVGFVYLYSLYRLGLRDFGEIDSGLELLVNRTFSRVLRYVSKNGIFKLLVRRLFSYYRLYMDKRNKMDFRRVFGDFDESVKPLAYVDYIGMSVVGLEEVKERKRRKRDESKAKGDISEFNGEGIDVLGSVYGYI